MRPIGLTHGRQHPVALRARRRFSSWGKQTLTVSPVPAFLLTPVFVDATSGRWQVNRQILKEEEEKAKIQKDLSILTDRLSKINETLARKVQARNEYDRTVQETEVRLFDAHHTIDTFVFSGDSVTTILYGVLIMVKWGFMCRVGFCEIPLRSRFIGK